MRWIGLAFFLTACAVDDVGAPCNHGAVSPPQSRLVTFPALSCNDLLCVYGEDRASPPECTVDADCNPSGDAAFRCEAGGCRLSMEYVLERSMCSKRCTSDDDCATGPDDTACARGFECVVLQQLGELCCERMCVCADDLPNTRELEARCADDASSVCAPA